MDMDRKACASVIKERYEAWESRLGGLTKQWMGSIHWESIERDELVEDKRIGL